MSEINTQLALSARYRTSEEADTHSEALRRALAFDTRAQVARLAIGRSLAMGRLSDVAIDAGGRDIPATAMFSADNIGAWIGLIVTHAVTTDSANVDSMDALRVAIRTHWHRGASALWADWEASDCNYDKFIETLVVRRSEMPEFGDSQRGGDAPGTGGGQAGTASAPVDLSQGLLKALDELGIKAQVKGLIHGPRITRYRVLLINLGDLTKIGRSMSQLGLALNLGNALPSMSNGDEPRTVFIDLPRPKSGWSVVGVERLRTWAYGTPNTDPNQLLVYAGVSVTGEDVAFDLATAPHVLVGGTTGSGKSVCLHSLILSLLLRQKPDALQLALIDPKQVDFARYSKIPNLFGGSIAVETPQARAMLDALVGEMESRYATFSQIGVANIGEARKKGSVFPSIVVFIEEMADIVSQDKNIEPLIERLAQKARAAGIHLILATQRPDAATFSGLIRSNIPARIALMVQKSTESKIILDDVGAESLLGSGDMLLRLPGESVRRAHGPFISLTDITQILANVKN